MEKGTPTNKLSKAEKKEVLLPYCFEPEKFEEVIYHNNEIVIIRDKFPKARFHWLIMPKGISLRMTNRSRAGVHVQHSDLRRSHLPLLHAMAQAAVQLISGVLIPSLKFVAREERHCANAIEIEGEEERDQIELLSLPFFVGFHAGTID